MEDIKKILGINDPNIVIIKIGETVINKIIFKTVEIKSIKKKYKCPICNNYTNSIHDKLKPIKLKELDIAGNRLMIIVNKRRFICHKCQKKFTEELGINLKESSLTNKVKIKIRKDLLNASLNIKTIAELNHVGSGTVRNELIDAMKNYLKQLTLLPSVISFDEFKADTNEGKYALVINDILHRKVLDILPTRKKEYLINYLTNVTNRYTVKYVISDMYEPYLIVTKIMFPKAKFVVDKFHFVRYIMDALDKIRIRLQKEYGEKSKNYQLLKNKKNITLLRIDSNKVDWFTYTKRYQNNKLVEILKYDLINKILSINDELKRGYQLKEEFLDIVNYISYEESERTLLCWIELCEQSGIEEFKDASKTIKNWLPYICNSFIDKRYTNGFTEGTNNKIKVVKRIAYGYKNFQFYRLRLMYIFNGKQK